ncbi:MAG: tetratricopeptide repeat protein [Flavobacterium sp.]|nr:tetratricopeptide repeat protein [Flavobacterium sp.]
MKKLLYIFLFFTQIFWAQNSFEKGNDLYRKGNYSEAVSEYESVLKTKKHSAELYFNIGNCYYKLNKVAPAVYNYEKALLLNPKDIETQNNLKFAQKLAIDDFKEVPKVGFRKMLQDLTATFCYDTWGWIAVGLATVFLLLFIGYYFSRTTLSKRLFFIGMFVVLFVIIISVASAIFQKDAYKNDRPAVVFAEVTPMKNEPKSDAQDAVVLHEGTKVYVLEVLDDWKKIQLPDETEGWVEASAIKELK